MVEDRSKNCVSARASAFRGQHLHRFPGSIASGGFRIMEMHIRVVGAESCDLGYVVKRIAPYSFPGPNKLH